MNKALFEICINDLFSDYEELKNKYKEDTINSILRVRDMYLWLVKYPFKKDAEFVKEDCGRYKISRPAAYADLNLIKSLIPDLSKSSKDFNKWKFTEMILETYEIAKFKKDVRTMERAVATFAKYTGLDKVEEERLPLDQIIPQPFVPSDDPSVLGFKQLENRREVIDKLVEKYSRDIPELIDIQYEEADVKAILNADDSNIDNSKI